jgi:SSS family solute:Na+ symporter
VHDLNWVALAVFIVLFGFITWMGFAAARWRRGDLDQLHEWGLGGRRFGTVITWFLVGGDVYTAYTFIAIPALAFGAGAIAFFAVPYTIIIYPLMFLILRRLWNVCHKHGYITAGDFVKGRFGNRWLALAVCVTGIVATMPYIALQLVGLQVVIGALGVSGSGLIGDLPLFIAFVILAAFTYSSGLRAPASIAIVKDIGSSRAEHHRRLQRLCHSGLRLRLRVVSLPAFADGHLERQQRQSDSPQCCDVARLHIHARSPGAVRFLRDRKWRGQAS